MTETGTPRAHGYRMPAEWAEHAATWIAWPHNANDWPGKFQAIPWVYTDIVRHLSRVEDVHILVNDAAAEKRAKGILKRSAANLARVHFHQWPTNRVWTRLVGHWWKCTRARLAAERFRMPLARFSAAASLTRMWTSSTRERLRTISA